MCKCRLALCIGLAGIQLSGVVLTWIVRGTSAKIDADCSGVSLAGLIALATSAMQCTRLPPRSHPIPALPPYQAKKHMYMAQKGSVPRPVLDPLW